MANKTLHIQSISQLHTMLGYPPPKHPLISIIDVADLVITESMVGTKVINDLYSIALKDKSCAIEYGRNHFDFDEGVLTFTGAKQMLTPTQTQARGQVQGWVLYFHPDLIRTSSLGQEIDNYSFFNYDIYEALHLSLEEEQTLNDCLEKIRHEYSQRIDNLTQRVIVSTLDLMLNYCQRYYERQFNTRTTKHKGVVVDFETALKKYFDTNQHIDTGFPSIQYFAEKTPLSQHYFSDLLKKETGRSAKDHINDFVIEKAKTLLVASDDSVSEIAYSLGFNYPHYFTRLFKAKTGQTPIKYRAIN